MGAKQQGFKSDVLNVGSLNLGKSLGSMVLAPKTFSSGKVGFYGQGALSLKCGKESYKFQVGITVTAIENAKQTVDEEIKQAVLAAASMTADTLLRGRTGIAKEFSTGSVGFHHGDKIQLEVNGSPLNFQLGVLVTAHGSKEWKTTRPETEAKAEQPAAE
jgi:hypothetical protein